MKIRLHGQWLRPFSFDIKLSNVAANGFHIKNKQTVITGLQSPHEVRSASQPTFHHPSELHKCPHAEE